MEIVIPSIQVHIVNIEMEMHIHLVDFIVIFIFIGKIVHMVITFHDNETLFDMSSTKTMMDSLQKMIMMTS